MTRARVAVVGSLNMDLAVQVGRIPAPGETVPGDRFTTAPGGKGANQAVAAARCGADVVMVGAVGDDPSGDALVAVLREAGVDVAGVARAAAPTGTAHITVDAAGENSIVVVPGANATLGALTPDQVDAVAGADVLLLQAEVPVGASAQAARAVRAAGGTVVLTPAPVDPLLDDGALSPAARALLAEVDLLVPNEHEAVRLATALTGAAPEGVDAAAHVLLAVVPEVVVTLGAAGCRHLTRAGGAGRQPAPVVTAVDTTAAGDSFTGALAVALGEGRARADALRWAVAAAALSVQRPGAAPSLPLRVEVDALAAVLAGP